MPNTPLVPAINLLSERKRKYSVETAFFARLRAMAGVVLLVYGFLLAGFLIILFVGVNQLTAVEASISREEVELKQLSQQESQYFLLTEKLDLIESHLQDQSERQNALESVYTFISPGIEFSNVSFGEDEKSVIVTVLAADIFVLDTFLAQVDTAVSNAVFSQVEVRDLRRDGSGLYRFECDFLIIPSTPKSGEK